MSGVGKERRCTAVLGSSGRVFWVLFGGVRGLCCMDFPVVWGMLLHGCAGAIGGFAAWIPWGNLKDVLLDGFLKVLLGGYQRELRRDLQSDYPGDRRGICCMCAWRERGKGLLEMRVFGGCSRTCFVQEKYKKLPGEAPCAKCMQSIAEEPHPIFKTGCKICWMSQIAFQHLTQSSAKSSLLHTAKHLFLLST